MATKVTQIIIDIGANADDFAIGYKKDRELSDGEVTQTVIERKTMSASELDKTLVDAVNAVIDEITDIAGATVDREDVVLEAKATFEARSLRKELNN